MTYYPEEVYRKAWQEACDYVNGLPDEERRELRENRESGDRWAAEIVAGHRDPLDSMPDPDGALI